MSGWNSGDPASSLGNSNVLSSDIQSQQSPIIPVLSGKEYKDLKQTVLERIDKARNRQTKHSIQNSKLETKLTKIMLEGQEEELRLLAKANHKKCLKMVCTDRTGKQEELHNKITQRISDLFDYLSSTSKLIALGSGIRRLDSMTEWVRDRMDVVAIQNMGMKTASDLLRGAKGALLQNYHKLMEEISKPDIETVEERNSDQNTLSQANSKYVGYTGIIENFNRVVELEACLNESVNEASLMELRNHNLKKSIVQQATLTNTFNKILEKYFPSTLEYLHCKKGQLANYVGQLQQLSNLAPDFKLKLLDIKINLNLHNNSGNEGLPLSTQKSGFEQQKASLLGAKLQRWRKRNKQRETQKVQELVNIDGQNQTSTLYFRIHEIQRRLSAFDVDNDTGQSQDKQKPQQGFYNAKHNESTSVELDPRNLVTHTIFQSTILMNRMSVIEISDQGDSDSQ